VILSCNISTSQSRENVDLPVLQALQFVRVHLHLRLRDVLFFVFMFLFVFLFLLLSSPAYDETLKVAFQVMTNSILKTIPEVM
jgi:hypothetical protein